MIVCVGWLLLVPPNLWEFLGVKNRCFLLDERSEKIGVLFYLFFYPFFSLNLLKSVFNGLLFIKYLLEFKETLATLVESLTNALGFQSPLLKLFYFYFPIQKNSHQNISFPLLHTWVFELEYQSPVTKRLTLSLRLRWALNFPPL